LGDIEVIHLELALADLAVVERRLERLRSAARGSHREEFQAELGLLEKAREHLVRGEAMRDLDLEPGQRRLLRGLNLLTAKPLMYVANVGEEDLPGGGKWAEQVVRRAQEEGLEAVVLSAAVEEELTHWPPLEAKAFREELGMKESGLTRLTQAGYRLLSLITFFTTTGGREVRAWTLSQGQTVLEAAGTVHSDMAAGFIRAEVLHYRDLLAAGSSAAAREEGLIRVEGQDCQVQNGDIIHIRFRA
jgi:ribosome-binding ATPase YchF (GTP1/OBG family)